MSVTAWQQVGESCLPGPPVLPAARAVEERSKELAWAAVDPEVGDLSVLVEGDRSCSAQSEGYECHSIAHQGCWRHLLAVVFRLLDSWHHVEGVAWAHSAGFGRLY